MENLAPPYACTVEIKMNLKSGLSLRSSLRKYLAGHDDEFAQALGRWFFRYEQYHQAAEGKELRKSPYRLNLLQLLAAGLAGESIFEGLDALAQEMHAACADELDEAVKMQPLKLMLPLMFLQVPAFLLMVLGPVLRQFLTALSG